MRRLAVSRVLAPSTSVMIGSNWFSGQDHGRTGGRTTWRSIHMAMCMGDETSEDISKEKKEILHEAL